MKVKVANFNGASFSFSSSDIFGDVYQKFRDAKLEYRCRV